MVSSCVAINCKKRFIKNDTIKFHKFPKDPELRKKWTIALRRKNYVPGASVKICSQHFKTSDYTVNHIGNIVLKNNAVPSIFDFPKGRQRFDEKSRRKRKEVEVMDLYTPAVLMECIGVKETDESENVEQMESPSNPKLTVNTDPSILAQVSSASPNGDQDVATVNKNTTYPQERENNSVTLEDFREDDLEDPLKRHLYWVLTQRKIEIISNNNINLQNKVDEQAEEISVLNLLVKDLRKDLYGLKN